jgi:beta-phosphoglucomutase family hydrolase
MLGLPDEINALLFDLDGVLSQTSKVHAAAWKEMFDEYLKSKDGPDFKPFDLRDDYVPYVDGKNRYDGIRSFLKSRDIELPEGSPDDPPEADTVYGLGARKNVLVLEYIKTKGVDAYPGSVKYLEAAQAAGLKIAVVSSSANAEAVLSAAGIDHFIEKRVDGKTSASLGLAGKPKPDTFLEGARELGVAPAHAAVFEDALSGVAAGHAGNFGIVVGVNRENQRQALLDHGATIVVDDLEELLGAPAPASSTTANAEDAA